MRVPPQAQGGRFKGTHVCRTLKTRDKAEALRRLPGLYNSLLDEFDREALSISEGASPVPVSSGETTEALSLPILTIEEACQLSRERLLQGERVLRLACRQEGVRGALAETRDPVTLAREFRGRIEQSLTRAKAELMMLDYSEGHRFLSVLETEGRGRVVDREATARAITKTSITALQDILSDDDALLTGTERASAPVVAVKPIEGPGKGTSGAPKLSAFVEAYIAKRGSGLSGERGETIRATVRDLIEITSDKPVDTYGPTDAEAFEDILRVLPPNWRKLKSVRHLSLKRAATKARAEGMAPQAPKTIRKKWTALFGVFKHAAVKYPLHNPFVAEALVLDEGGPANAEWDTFTSVELQALLASTLPGNLHWLTWLGHFTGARLNELCQLTTGHVKQHGDIHYLYFSPEMRLKTGEKESCIRAVPLRQELIDKGFLDFVAGCAGNLFPDIPQHSSGRHSDAPSKAFSRHLRDIGIKRKGLSFQSLRHTFIAAFKRSAPRDVETRERLVGHAVSGVAGRYGNSYEAEAHDTVLLEERARVLETLKF